MSHSDDNHDALRQQIQANTLGLVVLAVDLYLYKAQIAQKRWATPGGNDAADDYYTQALVILGRTSWPSTMKSTASELGERIAHLRKLLRAKDVTSAGFASRQVEAVFRTLQEQAVMVSLAPPQGRNSGE